MKNNNGFSFIIAILGVLVLLTIGGYFGYTYFKKTETPKPSIQEKEEISYSNPSVIQKDGYLEIVDSNSNKKVSIKIPNNTVIDISYSVGEGVKPDTQRLNKNEKYVFDDFRQEKAIYNFSYTPKLIIPQTQWCKVTGCDYIKISITGLNNSYNSILEEKRKSNPSFTPLNQINDAKFIDKVKNYKLNDKEFTLNNFKASTFFNLPQTGGGNIETLVEVENNYSLIISLQYQFQKNEKDEQVDKDASVELYKEVLKSVSEIK